MKMSLITVPGQLALIDVHDLSKRSWVLPLFSSFLMRKSCLVFVVCFFFSSSGWAFACRLSDFKHEIVAGLDLCTCSFTHPCSQGKSASVYLCYENM